MGERGGQRELGVRSAGAAVGGITSVVALGVMVACPVEGRTESAFETPPVLRAADLVPEGRLTGPRYRIDDAVPTDGYLARFTIDSDFGTFEARGPGMLELRLHEVAALEQLAAMESSEVFVSGLKDTARETGRSLGRAVANPVETVQGIPAGVGRLFQRTSRAARTGVQQLGDMKAESAASGEGGSAEVATAAAGRAGRVAIDVLGFDTARRRLAKQLAVDPYTTNAVLATKLDEIATAAFAGGLGVNFAQSMIPGGRLVSTTTMMTDWVWDTAPGDLRVEIEQKLVALGESQDVVDRFLRQGAYSLSLQAALVVALDGLESVPDRGAVMPWALSAESEDQARFVVNSLRMLGRYHETVAPVAAVEFPGPAVGRTKAGGIVVVAPVDYLSWTSRVAGFARRPDLKASDRSVWLAGQASPRARQELTRLDWSVHERSLLTVPKPGG